MSEDLPRVLCVDDEVNILNALERSLGEYYDVATAPSGARGLEILETEGPFEVVVSDMRMPEMDGATFLTRVRERWPDTVRILLTGQADTQSTIAAINDGAVFRFLCKPCPEATLLETLRQATSAYRTATAERRLLETTFTAVVRTLSEVLSMSAPWAFRRAAFARSCVRHALAKLKWPDGWMYEVAAGLSQIGAISIPEETVRRYTAQRVLNESDRQLMAEHPETAYRLLKAIPRLERVAEIVRYQAKPAPPGTPLEIARGSELLRAALAIGLDVTRGRSIKYAVEALDTSAPSISPAVIASLADFREDSGEAQSRAALIAELSPGWVLGENVSTTKGRLLLSKGHELTEVAIVTLRRLHAAKLIQEPIYVHRRKPTAAPAEQAPAEPDRRTA